MNPKKVGDSPERDVSRADTEVCPGIPWNVERGRGHTGRVEHGPGGGDPGMVRLRRPKKHERRERRVCFLHVSEPGLPGFPEVAEPVEPMNSVIALDHL